MGNDGKCLETLEKTAISVLGLDVANPLHRSLTQTRDWPEIVKNPMGYRVVSYPLSPDSPSRRRGKSVFAGASFSVVGLRSPTATPQPQPEFVSVDEADAPPTGSMAAASNCWPEWTRWAPHRNGLKPSTGYPPKPGPGRTFRSSLRASTAHTGAANA